ncbi:MAG: hypothetical protein V1710_04260 [Candidatus Bathyarchaeota archaeon]
MPEELSERLSGYSFSRYPWVESKAEIYVLKHISEPTLYLKIRRDSRLLETEYNMLKWINQQVKTKRLANRTQAKEFASQCLKDMTDEGT